MWADAIHRAFMRTHKLFSGFDDDGFEALGELLETKTLAPRERLFEAGNAADACYIVVEGQLLTSIERSGEAHEMARLDPGDLVGQVALLDGQPHAAAAEAVDGATVLRIDRETFQARFDAGDPVAYGLMDALCRVLVRQLRSANELLMQIAQAEQDASTPKSRSHPEVQAVFADIAGKLDAARVQDMDLTETIPPPSRKD